MPDGAAMPYWPIAMRAERAAAYLDLSATYFREHIAPTLTAIRPSVGVVLYHRQDLDAWLDRFRPVAATSVVKQNPWHR